MAGKLSFSLVSPEREVFAGLVDQVDAPGVEGDFGVLADHAPFMTALREEICDILILNQGAAETIRQASVAATAQKRL